VEVLERRPGLEMIHLEYLHGNLFNSATSAVASHFCTALHLLLSSGLFCAAPLNRSNIEADGASA
jgi:hypothetical protein